MNSTENFDSPSSSGDFRRSAPLKIGSFLIAIAKSRLYWGLLLFAIVPILIESVHLNVVFGMLIYFSLFWFFVFRPLVTTSTPGWSFLVDILAYVFTSVIGTSFAAFVESFWVQIGAGPLLKARTLNIAVPSFIAFVGFTEEIAKQLVVFLGATFVRKRSISVRASEFIILGVSSGLGFSAIENVSYVQEGIMNEVVHSVVGEGVVTALSRALYTPFLHGMWAGIAAFGLGIVAKRGIRFWWAIPLFLTFSAIGHGFYDAVIGTHVIWGLLDVAVSYFVFLILLLNRIRLKQKS